MADSEDRRQPSASWRTLLGDLEVRVNVLSSALDEIRVVVRQLTEEAALSSGPVTPSPALNQLRDEQHTEPAIPSGTGPDDALAPVDAESPRQTQTVLEPPSPEMPSENAAAPPLSESSDPGQGLAWGPPDLGWPAEPAPSSVEDEKAPDEEAPEAHDEQARDELSRMVERVRLEMAAADSAEPEGSDLSIEREPEPADSLAAHKTAESPDAPDAPRAEVSRAPAGGGGEAEASTFWLKSDHQLSNSDDKDEAAASPAAAEPGLAGDYASPLLPSGAEGRAPFPAPAVSNDQASLAEHDALPASLIIEDPQGQVELVRVYATLNQIECADQAVLLNYTPHSVTIRLGSKAPSVEALKEAMQNVFARNCQVTTDGYRIAIMLEGGERAA